MRPVLFILLLAALALAGARPTRAAERDALFDPPGLLQFAPLALDSDSVAVPSHLDAGCGSESEWLSAPFGERLLTPPEAWRGRASRGLFPFPPAPARNRTAHREC